MRLKAIQILACALLLMLCVYSRCQDPGKKGSITISVNIYKLLMGLPNLEIEYYVSPGVSVYAFNEILIFGKKLKQRNHPVYVFRTGGRYHFIKDGFNRNDVHSGFYAGISRSMTTKVNNPFLGMDLGYKYYFDNSFNIYPRGLITCSLRDTAIMPGFEVLLGKTFAPGL